MIFNQEKGKSQTSGHRKSTSHFIIGVSTSLMTELKNREKWSGIFDKGIAKS